MMFRLVFITYHVSLSCQIICLAEKFKRDKFWINYVLKNSVYLDKLCVPKWLKNVNKFLTHIVHEEVTLRRIFKVTSKV